MYLDKHDMQVLKNTLEEHAVLEDQLYLIYRDKDGEMAIACGEDEIFRFKEKASD